MKRVWILGPVILFLGIGCMGLPMVKPAIEDPLSSAYEDPIERRIALGIEYLDAAYNAERQAQQVSGFKQGIAELHGARLELIAKLKDAPEGHIFLLKDRIKHLDDMVAVALNDRPMSHRVRGEVWEEYQKKISQGLSED